MLKPASATRSKLSIVAVAVSALAALSPCATAPAQSPYGTVEFRWRERAVGVTNFYNLPPSAVPLTGPDANGVSNPTVATDARFVLILEARVTRAAGNTDLGGLQGFTFDMHSGLLRSQGTFAASSIDGSADLRNAAPATAAIATALQPGGPGLTLPAGATSLPGTDGNNDRGLFGPFRKAADIGGVKNGPAIGVQNAATGGPQVFTASLENIVVDADTAPLSTPGARTRIATTSTGLNAWVPVFTLVYNVQDTTNAFPYNSIYASVDGFTSVHSNIYGFRGVANPDAAGADRWLLDSPRIPTFHNFPAPGAAGVLGVAAVFVTRRRRGAL